MLKSILQTLDFLSSYDDKGDDEDNGEKEDFLNPL